MHALAKNSPTTTAPLVGARTDIATMRVSNVTSTGSSSGSTTLFISPAADQIVPLAATSVRDAIAAATRLMLSDSAIGGTPLAVLSVGAGGFVATPFSSDVTRSTGNWGNWITPRGVRTDANADDAMPLPVAGRVDQAWRRIDPSLTALVGFEQGTGRPAVVDLSGAVDGAWRGAQYAAS